jgi:hypothetical protein
LAANKWARKFIEVWAKSFLGARRRLGKFPGLFFSPKTEMEHENYEITKQELTGEARPFETKTFPDEDEILSFLPFRSCSIPFPNPDGKKSS